MDPLKVNCLISREALNTKTLMSNLKKVLLCKTVFRLNVGVLSPKVSARIRCLLNPKSF